MPAKTPEEICNLFQGYMAEGGIESLLNIYDAEAVFLNQSGEAKKGRQAIRQELIPLASAKAIFDFKIRQVIRSGEIALMHTEWTVSAPQPMSVYAIEVAPSARRYMALAHRRSIYGRQVHKHPSMRLRNAGRCLKVGVTILLIGKRISWCIRPVQTVFGIDVCIRTDARILQRK
jgi:ketosteroid isomerase-like protein